MNAIKKPPARKPPSIKIVYIDDSLGAAEHALKKAFPDIQVLDSSKSDLIDAFEHCVESCDVFVCDIDLKKGVFGQSTAVSPKDGPGLIGVIRSQRKQAAGLPRPVFAILSGEIKHRDYFKGLSDRLPVLAAKLGVTLVGEKGGEDQKAFIKGLAALNAAVAVLKRDFVGNSSDGLVKIEKALGLGKNDGFLEAARRDIRAFDPPIEDVQDRRDYVALLDWMAHRILPYPSFLIDRFELAMILGVLPKELDRFLKRHAGFLDKARYRGVLHELDGPRWWRAGALDAVWQGTKGRPSDPEAVEIYRRKLFDRTALKSLDAGHPVLLYDADGVTTGIVADAGECVRFRPEGWPDPSRPAWIRADDVGNDTDLRGRVLPEDLDRLAEGA
ncbi:MAG: hypothetical protein NBV67_04310 [Tagaea sp.]|nr:hypothetical protein [Tagaea sp.]